MGKGMTSFSTNVLQFSWKCERSQRGLNHWSHCKLHHGLQLAGQQFPGWPFQELVVSGQTKTPSEHSMEEDIQD